VTTYQKDFIGMNTKLEPKDQGPTEEELKILEEEERQA